MGPLRLSRAHAGRGGLLGLLLLLPLASGQAAPSAVEPGWKACSFNERVIGCRDSHGSDGRVRILWKDGKAMSYRLVREGFPISLLRDSLGGLWEREILIQGNAVFVNRANGHRIVVPLRLEPSRLPAAGSGRAP